jgi:DNA-directed RNA polymerase subunit omega
MIYPSIDKLLNIVDSKYKLVHLVSKRSRQMYETNQLQKPENQYTSKKNIGRALEEISEDLIHIK